MSTGMLVSIEEYLNTTYRPDCDYVGGELIERTVGEHDHGWLQTLLGVLFFAKESVWHARAIVELRVQVAPNRFRVPDVCVVRKGAFEQVVTRPPVLCIEILSKDDTVRALEERIHDYLNFGVPTVWLIDPKTRLAFVYTPDGSRREAIDGILRAVNPGYPEIEIAVAALFE
jgi:Uma2 family endonuclease